LLPARMCSILFLLFEKLERLYCAYTMLIFSRPHMALTEVGDARRAGSSGNV